MKKIIDLGYHPFADSFIPPDRQYDNLPVYNLSCAMCEECGQVQTVAKTDPIERYSLFDYSYTSSNSKLSRNHWDNYCSECISQTNMRHSSFVLEIGSNDGYLLEQFKNKGFVTLGVDASRYMADLAMARSIPTVVGLFDEKMAEDIIHEHGQSKLVIANNVFNHSENPLEFAKGAYQLLEEGGFFVYELPYWKLSVETQKIDQIYHEHVSYFTATSSKNLLDSVGFKIVSIEVVNYHGGSLRVYAKKTSEDIKCETLCAMIEAEKSLFEVITYTELMARFTTSKNKLLQRLHNIKNAGGKILAIGAAAKGNTLLNLLGLDGSMIDWVTDVSPYKQGKLTPLTNIPICGDDIVSTYDEVYALILSWNLSAKIKRKLRALNPKIHFINFYTEETL